MRVFERRERIYADNVEPEVGDWRREENLSMWFWELARNDQDWQLAFGLKFYESKLLPNLILKSNGTRIGKIIETPTVYLNFVL